MKTFIFIAILFCVFLSSCAGEMATTSNNASANVSRSSAPVGNTGGGGGGGSGSGSGTEDATVTLDQKAVQTQTSLQQTETVQQQPTVTERKIIRNADLSLESNNPEEAQQKITTIAESKGGFVVESTQSSSDVKATTRDTVVMTVRVPAEKFNEALDEIRKTASRVIVETVKGEDVTEEFIDIEARLKAQRALEAQFLEIMKRATSVEDALDVQRQLAQVRGEIEKIEGRLRFLENQASLSTIKIRLQTPTAFSTQSSGFFYRLGEAFGDGFDAALTFILGFVRLLIALLPFLILVVLPIYLVIRYFWKKRREQKKVSEIVREEIKEK